MSVSTSTKRVDARLEAARVFWGYGECRSITFVDDVAGSLTDEYWDLNVLLGDGTEKQYYVLLGGTTSPVDPAPAGKTKIDVTYVDGDTKETIAGLFVAALASAGVECFATDAGSGVVRYENWYPGAVTTEDASNAPSLTLAVLQAGLGGDLGATKEGIELTLEQSVVDIQANQFGGLILDQIQQGSAAALAAAFLETNFNFWETVVGSVTGGKVEIPAGSDVVGFGESKLFQSLLDLGGRLILHPIRLASTDRSADVCFWKSAPVPESINYDGTDSQAMATSFTAYLDASKKAEVNLFAYGDWTQPELDA